MPKIQFKQETLNGRAHIIAYADREYLTLRIHRGNTQYTNISLGTTDLKVAHDKALDVYAATINHPPFSRSKKHHLANGCKEFLAWKQEQCESGAIKESSVDTYTQRIYQRIIPYAKISGINNISDIGKSSFENYSTFYGKVEIKGQWKKATKGLSASTINSDITTINELMSWMVKRNYLDANSFPLITKLRQTKECSDDANPAFLPGEWDAMKSCMNRWVEDNDMEADDALKAWRKRWLYNWIFFMYHFGGRPHEARALRLGDLEIQTMPDGRLKGMVRVAPSTKGSKRTAVMNGYWIDTVQSHLFKGVELRNQQIKDHNQLVETGAIKNYRWRHQGRIPLLLKPDKDTPLFLNPLFHIINKEDKRSMRKFEADARLDEVRWDVDVVSLEQIRAKYQALVDEAMTCFFKGKERGTESKRFTLYSLRSTHITHNLLNGARIRLIADNVGTSESDIESRYVRLNNLLNIKELGMHRQKVAPQDELFVDA